MVVTKVDTNFDTGSFPDNVTTIHTTTEDPSAMYTVSHTTAMTAAAMIADLVSPESLGDISAIPAALAETLTLESRIADLAAEWITGAFIALGSGPMLAAAEEAHIKIAEASRRAVRHQEPESFLHGPAIQLLDSDRILTFVANDGSIERTRAITQLTIDVGCGVAWIAPSNVPAPETAAHLVLPDLPSPLMPIPAAVPAQLLAGHLAARHDIEADGFRREDPVYGAALSKLRT